MALGLAGRSQADVRSIYPIKSLLDFGHGPASVLPNRIWLHAVGLHLQILIFARKLPMTLGLSELLHCMFTARKDIGESTLICSSHASVLDFSILQYIMYPFAHDAKSEGKKAL